MPRRIDYAKVKRLHAKGYHLDRIARQCGCTVVGVKYALQQMGLWKPRPSWGTKEIELVVETVNGLATILKRSPSAIINRYRNAVEGR